MSEGAIQEHPAVFEARSAAQDAKPHAHHDRGLLAIGIFKLLKSAFFFCVGLGAIHLLHQDLGDVLMRIAQTLHWDPMGGWVGFLARKVDLIDVHRLREAGLLAFGYSGLALTEGVGLMLEKVWAEYLTLGLTISFLPWELYELARGLDLMKVMLLLANLVVLGYLVWLLRRKRSAGSAG